VTSSHQHLCFILVFEKLCPTWYASFCGRNAHRKCRTTQNSSNNLRYWNTHQNQLFHHRMAEVHPDLFEFHQLHSARRKCRTTQTPSNSRSYRDTAYSQPFHYRIQQRHSNLLEFLQPPCPHLPCLQSLCPRFHSAQRNCRKNQIPSSTLPDRDTHQNQPIHHHMHPDLPDFRRLHNVPQKSRNNQTMNNIHPEGHTSHHRSSHHRRFHP
jgi:hypothetical protein